MTSRDDFPAVDTLLLEVLLRARARGAETLTTLAVPGTNTFAALLRAGFFKGPGFSVQMVPFGTAAEHAAESSSGRWLISGADFDVI